MSLFSPLLIICFDQDDAPAIAQLAQSLGYPDAHIVTGGMKEGIDALNLRTTSPDYIIIDIGSRGTDVLTDMDNFALYCEPTVRVAVIGNINDIAFYRELKSR